MTTEAEAAGSRRVFFAPTMWSTILEAKEGDEETRFEALGRLLSRYRKPIILEIQSRQKCTEPDAEDLAHRLIGDWLRRNFLQHVDPAKGRFRNFVKACIRNFLHEVRGQEEAEKRNRGRKPVSLDEVDEQGQPLCNPPADQPHVATVLDRQWALQILETSMNQLERDCVAVRQGPLFSALKPTLSRDPETESLASIGVRLGMSEEAVKVAAHRMRKRLGKLIGEAVRETVGSEEDWREELRYLIELLGHPEGG